MKAKKTETDEDIRRFVLENEERIREILRAEIPEEVPCPDEETGRKFLRGIGPDAEKGKKFVKGITDALMDKDVQKHFVRMWLEMAMGIGALVKALPLPEEMSPFVDAVSERKDALENVVSKRAGTPRKKKQPVEKIEVK
jgi:hypothetical protein